MKKRFLVIVLDGFGIGAMQDELVRVTDTQANTLGSILEDYPELRLPNLEKLGLMNAFGQESKNMKFSCTANWGKSELRHFGADTFMGHQEIMGTLPQKPIAQPFQSKVEAIHDYLVSLGRKVVYRYHGELQYLLVDDYVTVGDNIDADLGMAYNLTAPLDFIPFDTLLQIGYEVRKIATVGRVIPFGGTGTTIEDILAAEETRNNQYIGIHAVKSKSYNEGYVCRHLGYGVDAQVQVPTILGKQGMDVTLIGKVADIVANEKGVSISCVPTEEVMRITIEEFDKMEQGFICTNVQETDLAGHSQDSFRYKQLLELADLKIGILLEKLEENDILLVMADHGNDPKIGHNMHTREHIPLLASKKGVFGCRIGIRNTLSDVGATVAEFFDVEAPENGKSFLSLLIEK